MRELANENGGIAESEIVQVESPPPARAQTSGNESSGDPKSGAPQRAPASPRAAPPKIGTAAWLNSDPTASQQWLASSKSELVHDGSAAANQNGGIVETDTSQ